MLRLFGTAITCIVGCLLMFTIASVATTLTFIGPDIPSRLETGSAYIFSGSDSLYLNSRLLQTGTDYEFQSGEGFFDFSRLVSQDGDTLVVIYQPVPSWLSRSYGRPVPPVSTSAVRSQAREPRRSAVDAFNAGSNIRLTGAKSFRFTSRLTGASDFGQSLDLTITGELTPGLEITGSVSDRGHDPAYGVANSRLSELDKINLSLRSSVLHARVGDIIVRKPSGRRGGKPVSGISFQLTYPVWRVHAAAARPKGLFRSYKTTGRNGFQGPYRIGEGNDCCPIVPGSERVWLDGKPLERGADKDYTIDYSAGSITFSVKHPVDDRSRIEIDYEPQATDYKEELFTLGGGGQLDDSSVYFSVELTREGDDRRQPLAGELTTTDAVILKAAGDSTAFRSGAVPDTSGNYHLVVEPGLDSVFQYVGMGNGDHTVRFSYVGEGVGDYRFLGGDNYEYVGSSNGDYAPVIILPSPVRTELCESQIGFRNQYIGNVLLDLRGSRYDRNLLSDVDDQDNNAFFYNLRVSRDWQWQGRSNSFVYDRRVKEVGFNTHERLYAIDFDRTYMIPEGFSVDVDETIDDYQVSLTPVSPLRLRGGLSRLDYDQRFYSRAGSISADLDISRYIALRANFRRVTTRLDSARLSGEGSASNYGVDLNFRPTSAWELRTAYEHDRRVNEYFEEKRGTRYHRLELAADRSFESLRYELLVEDSLSNKWKLTTRRNRLTGSSRRRIGDFNYGTTLSYQWLSQPESDESSFLGRTDLRYHSTRHGWSVNASYTISEERRNARGITYLEVERGFGDYSYEDGNYVPDPDGNFIEVEEILSTAARVRRAQKSFYLRKDWQSVLVRFSSNIEEELKDDGHRELWWIVPFLSDEGQPYLFFSRRYDADVRFFSVRRFHVVNLRFVEVTENREITEVTHRRRSRTGKLALKETVGQLYFEQGVELFLFNRDDYFTSGGNIEGFKLSAGQRQVIAPGEISLGASFRRADSDMGERSVTYVIETGLRIRLLQRGEFRTRLELYRQELDKLTGVPSFQLTNNKWGEKGADWSAAFNYGMKGGLRLNFSVNGRHADNRTARVTVRGEVVAGF